MSEPCNDTCTSHWHIERLRLRHHIVNGTSMLTTRQPLSREDARWLKAHAKQILACLGEREDCRTRDIPPG